MKNGKVLTFPAWPTTEERDTLRVVARTRDLQWVVSVGRELSKEKLSIDLVENGDTLIWEVNIRAHTREVAEALRVLACSRMGIPSDALSCIKGQTQKKVAAQ